MRRILAKGLKLGSIVALAAILPSGCALAKPNLSFIYQIPAIREQLSKKELRKLKKYKIEITENRKKAYELFTKLYQENPELAEELGRIPDYGDNEVSDKDLEALVNMSDYYFESENPKIKEAFKEMLNVGIKDKRAYCSPLEALKWLAEKYEFKEGSDSYVNDPLSLSDFCLSCLLYHAWDYKEEERWGDPKKVIKRLNSPKLFDIFMDSKFTPKPTYYPQRSEVTIKTGRGDCKAYAIAAYDCLYPVGYDVYLFTMDPRSPKGHTICVIDMGKELFTLDNNLGLAGPFSSEEEIMRRFGFEDKRSIRERGRADMMSRFR